jgi:hypothetical protein
LADIEGLAVLVEVEEGEGAESVGAAERVLEVGFLFVLKVGHGLLACKFFPLSRVLGIVAIPIQVVDISALRQEDLLLDVFLQLDTGRRLFIQDAFALVLVVDGLVHEAVGVEDLCEKAGVISGRVTFERVGARVAQ